MSKTGGRRGSNQHKVRGVVDPAGSKTRGHSELGSALDLRRTQFGQTPIGIDAAAFLTPESAHLETLDELNEAELLNINDAVGWLEEHNLEPVDILKQSFFRELHRRMLCDVWTWTGHAGFTTEWWQSIHSRMAMGVTLGSQRTLW